MSTYQKSLIDEARPDEGNSLLPSETRKDKKPMELNQRLLKAIAVLFVASCALSYAIRGSNKTFSEAFLVSTQSTEPNMFASSEPNMFASSESRYVPLSPGKGYVTYNHARCANLDSLVKYSKADSEEDCARACLKHPFFEDTCINKYFSYANGGNCLHFDGVGDCEPNEDIGFDSFKFVDFGKCDSREELLGSGDDIDSLQDCQKLCTKLDKCKAYQWFDDGIPLRNGEPKCTLYYVSADSITNDAHCYKKENNQMVKVGDGWCMKPTDAFSGGSIARPDINLEFCEDHFLKFEKLEYMDFIPGQCSWYGRHDVGAEPGGFAVAVCENKQASYVSI